MAWGRAAQAHEAIWITVGGEDKLLPGTVVNDLLQKKLAEIEAKEGRKPGGRTRKRIKEELITALLPQAFVRPMRIDAMILPRLGVLAVDTAARKAAESVVSDLRHAMGSFPALPLNAEVAPRSVLTGFVAGDPLPAGLLLGSGCELRDPADRGRVRITDMDLHGDEIERHLEAGKQCTRLSLELEDRCSFEIGEDLVIRKFKLLDGAIDSLESVERDDIAQELEARFTLTAAEFVRVFNVLEKTFRLSKGE